MYSPPFTTVRDEESVRATVAAARSGWLVTTGGDGFPVATLLPRTWRGGTVTPHMARANRQWRDVTAGAPGLIIVGGAEAYISRVLVRRQGRSRTGRADVELQRRPPQRDPDGAPPDPSRPRR